jgi:diguanylate cyclase
VHDQLSGATDLIAGEDLPTVVPSDRSDELRVEACGLLDRARSEDRQQRWQAAVLTGDLLDRARRALANGDLTPSTFARVLRSNVLVRELADVPDLPADPLLDELVTHTTEYGLASHNAAAQALRGMLASSRGSVEEVMDAAVNAMVTLELVQGDKPSLERVFAANDIAALLQIMGLPDIAAQMYASAVADSAAAGLVREEIITLGNQVASEVLYGMLLERLGRLDEARSQFATAAEHARAGLRAWERADRRAEKLRDDHVAAFHAALGLVEASDELEADLRRHLHSSDAECRLLPAIVLARHLAATGRREQAVELLTELSTWPRLQGVQNQLRRAFTRQLAEVRTEPMHWAESGGLPGYVAALEAELGNLTQATGRVLRGLLERERLRRIHGPIRALAADDPLTGLPNRRALEELLAELAESSHPGAVAMVDLDALRVVNYRGSHADGDATLRAVAVAMRGTLPGTDTVIRYGGDEFVVLMPHDDLHSARAKVKRVVAAVAELPADRGFGVTASAGVIVAEPQESADSILVRADNAMTQAKHSGGNQVCTG